MAADPTTTTSAIERALRRLESTRAIDPAADAVAAAVRRATSDPTVKSVLSGTPIGHPVHPALTDVTMGLLHSASLLETIPTRWAGRAATTLLVAGLASSAPTVLTGLSDWSDTEGATRRVGAAHGALNALGLALYGTSLVRKLRGRPGRAKLWAWSGYVVMLGSWLLGGHLAYRRGVGVDEHAFTTFPEGWIATVALDDLPDRQLYPLQVAGTELVLFATDDGLYAVANRCSHLGGPLAEGHVHEEKLEVGCPWHHSMFRLTDGEVTRGPATSPQPSFETRVRNGIVEVRARPRA